MAVVTITKENLSRRYCRAQSLSCWTSGPAGAAPCRMLSPVVDEVAEERTDVKVGKVNVDEQPSWPELA